ncbi:MAG: metallophosphoesterase [Desulfobacterales bacterium]|nr:metallophosphoesterase [Desulfobacterales bacterium]
MRRTTYAIALIVFLSIAVLSCARTGGIYNPPPELAALPSKAPVYPETTFAVISDPHYYDPRLGTEGKAYQDYLISDRKLLEESGEIIDTAVNEISSLSADFVIVCGDLTKDGEVVNHQALAAKLKRLVDSGKQVFVVPGNHDVENGEAVRYTGAQTEPVPNISAGMFAEIYRDFGYRAALERDPDSLSYVVEPVPGLWLLALDTCKWQENQPNHEPHIDGAYSAQTFQWIERMLMKSRNAGKAVIVFQHHGILEHYPHNKKFYSDYMVADFERAGNMLSRFGVDLVFTGHWHAQDITSKTFDNPRRVIYDIETGSLVTAPCPYRRVAIDANQKAVIESRFITAIPSRPEGFTTYAADYVYNMTIKLADAKLKGYKVSEPDRIKINPQVARAYVTHLNGDEKKRIVIDTDGIGWWAKFVMFMQKDLLYGWTTDLPPADNRLTIDLAGGAGAE